MYLMSFPAKLKKSGNPDHPDKFISIYIKKGYLKLIPDQVSQP